MKKIEWQQLERRVELVMWHKILHVSRDVLNKEFWVLFLAITSQLEKKNSLNI